jgi:hypothetical protein
MSEDKSSGYIREDKVAEYKANRTKAGDSIKQIQKKMEKWADKIVVGANVKPHYADKKEGDVWVDADGKEWTKKNGIVQSISKFQNLKRPWFCPQCEKVMNNKLDDKFWILRGKCFDCVVAEEHKMRMDGTWEVYERRMMRENERSFLRHKILEHETYIKEFKEPTLQFEDGRQEVLATIDQFEATFDMLKKDVEFMKQRLDQIDKEELEEQNENHS